MQYTHKDTCNNQTLPHPTTPLGTLTHKTPPQHTFAGNSWTKSDLRVMSIVLGLLDTPSYTACKLTVVTVTFPFLESRWLWWTWLAYIFSFDLIGFMSIPVCVTYGQNLYLNLHQLSIFLDCRPWICKHSSASTCHKLFTSQHSIASQKTEIFIRKRI